MIGRVIGSATGAAGWAFFLGVPVSQSRPPGQGRLRRRTRSFRALDPATAHKGFGGHEEDAGPDFGNVSALNDPAGRRPGSLPLTASGFAHSYEAVRQGFADSVPGSWWFAGLCRTAVGECGRACLIPCPGWLPGADDGRPGHGSPGGPGSGGGRGGWGWPAGAASWPWWAAPRFPDS
jgi:hypothetical protein